MENNSKDVVITPAFISLLANDDNGKDTYIVRGKEEDRDKGIERLILEAVKNPQNTEIRWQPNGPDDAFSPVYDLVLRRTEGVINIDPKQSSYNFNEEDTQALRKSYKRFLPFEFELGATKYVAEVDMENDGSLAESVTYYQLDETGKQKTFLFYAPTHVDGQSTAQYHLIQAVAQKTLDVASAGEVIHDTKVPKPKNTKRSRKGKYSWQKRKKSYSADGKLINELDMLRLEDNGVVKSYMIYSQTGQGDLESVIKGDVTSLSFAYIGDTSKEWFNAEGEYEKGDYTYKYDIIEQGTYKLIDEVGEAWVLQLGDESRQLMILDKLIGKFINE